MPGLPDHLDHRVAHDLAVHTTNNAAHTRSNTLLHRAVVLVAAGMILAVLPGSVYHAFRRFRKYRGDKQTQQHSWSVERSSAVESQQIADQLFHAFESSTRAWWAQAIGYFVDRPNQRGLLAVDDHSGQVIGSVFGDECDDDMIALGPFSVLPTHSDRGIARALIQQLLDECLQSNPRRALVLVQSPTNIKAFALYSKLGFEVRYGVKGMRGFVAKPGSLSASTDVEVKRFALSDVDEAAALLKTALSGVCRRNYIRNMAMGQQLEPHGIGCVARTRADGRIVGFTTAVTSKGGVWCYNSVAAFQALYIHASNELQTLNDTDKYTPVVLMPLHNYTELRWLLAAGVQVVLQANVMIRNELHVRNGYGYCPSGGG